MNCTINTCILYSYICTINLFRPPFNANDALETYNLILKGINMIDFPRLMSRFAVHLIKKLCREAPSERLGYQRGGIQDIKNHK